MLGIGGGVYKDSLDVGKEVSNGLLGGHTNTAVYNFDIILTFSPSLSSFHTEPRLLQVFLLSIVTQWFSLV